MTAASDDVRRGFSVAFISTLIQISHGLSLVKE
jgi:hypothetical protein